MSPLPKKLFIKPGQRVLLLGAPPTLAAQLAPLPEGVTLTSRAGAGPYDHVLGYVRWQKDAEALARQALHLAGPAGSLWLAYPKRSAKSEGDVHRDLLWVGLAKSGWKGVWMIALDATWSAMRFLRAGAGDGPTAAALRRAKAAKPAKSKTGRKQTPKARVMVNAKPKATMLRRRAR